MIRRQLHVEIDEDVIQKIYEKVNSFQSKIKLIKHAKAVDISEVGCILSFGVQKGCIITIEAEGIDERESIEELSKFFKGEKKSNS